MYLHLHYLYNYFMAIMTIASYIILTYSYLYIIVVTDNVITNAKSVSTASLLEESLKSHPLFYVAAVVNVSQYVLGNKLSYILGAGDNTTDINNQVFHNRKVKETYFYFFRIFSFDSIPEVGSVIAIHFNFILHYPLSFILFIIE